MRSSTRFAWLPVVICLVLAITLSLPASAQDASPPETAWQSVVGGQIEAFRQNDAETAFSFAASGFHTTYPTAEAFFAVIAASGYAPIVQSRTHSFGSFTQIDDTEVVQEVNLVGRDLTLYVATYRLQQEEAGWRIVGVALRKVPGLAA
jgi:hypothetical protein